MLRVRATLVGVSVLLALVVPGSVWGADPTAHELEALRAKVAAQQRSIEELRTAVHDLSAALARSRAAAQGAEPLATRTARLERLMRRTRLGGWIDVLFRDSSRQGEDPFIDPQHFYLYVDSRFDERWRAFGEVEFEHLPHLEADSSSGELLVERLYLQHRRSDRLGFRLGKFNTPLGYWTPVHWAILVDTIQKPIHEDNAYVPRKQVGAEVFGFSAYTQRNPRARERRETTWILYADLHPREDLTLRGEFLRQLRSKGYPDRQTAYVKLRYDLGARTYLNYRFGVGDDDLRGAGKRHIENVLTLGFSPVASVRLKAEIARNSFEADGIHDDYVWGLYAGYHF